MYLRLEDGTSVIFNVTRCCHEAQQTHLHRFFALTFLRFIFHMQLNYKTNLNIINPIDCLVYFAITNTFLT